MWQSKNSVSLEFIVRTVVGAEKKLSNSIGISRTRQLDIYPVSIAELVL